MATYYIDPSLGVDGTGAEVSPFNSWASVTWGAGNTYLQKAGTTFTGAVAIGASGSSGNLIVVGRYGEGANPIITQGAAGTTVTAAARSYFTLQDLNIINTHATPASDNGIYLSSTAGSNIILQRLSISSVGYGLNSSQPVTNVIVDSVTVVNNTKIGIYFYGNPSTGVSVTNCNANSISLRYVVNNIADNNNITGENFDLNGIFIQNGSGTVSVKGNAITSIKAGFDGIQFLTGTFSSGDVSENSVTGCGSTAYRFTTVGGPINIEGNYSGNNGGNGYYLSSSSGFTVISNVCESCLLDGFVTVGGTHDILISGNIAKNNGTKSSTSSGDGFTFDGADYNLTVINNVSVGNTVSGFCIAAAASSGVLYGNLAYGNGGNWLVEGTGVDQVRGGFFFNQTAVNPTTGLSWVVKNNIGVGNYPVELHKTAISLSLAVLDYNRYLPLDDNNFATLNGLTSKISWATYHATYEAHSANEDPLFIDAANGNYHIPTTSPCYQAGIPVPAIHEQATPATDLDGNIIHFLPPSIGPYDGQGDTKTLSAADSPYTPTGYEVRGTAASPAKIKLGADNLVVDLHNLTAPGVINVDPGRYKVGGFVRKDAEQYLKGAGSDSGKGIIGSIFG